MLIDEMCNYGHVYVDAYNVPEDFKLPLFENPNVIDVNQTGFTVKRLSFSNLKSFLKLVKKEGIGILMRSPGPLCELPIKARYGFSLINLLFRYMGRGRVVYCGNCCSEGLMLSRKLERTYMNQLYMRSNESLQYAKKYFGNKVSYIPDLAYLMKFEGDQIQKNRVVAVDFRVSETDRDRVINDIRDIVLQFISYGYKIVIYYQVKGDQKFATELYDKIKNDSVEFRQSLLWYNDLIFYADKAFVLSNRLHSLLFGAVYGAVPIARITHEAKLSKINHVFRSSLSNEFFEKNYVDEPLLVKSLLDGYDSLFSTLHNDVERNAALIKATIKEYIEIGQYQ